MNLQPSERILNLLVYIFDARITAQLHAKLAARLRSLRSRAPPCETTSRAAFANANLGEARKNKRNMWRCHFAALLSVEYFREERS